MRVKYKCKHIFVVLLLSVSATVFAQSEITEAELRAHILFLTAETNMGRAPGGTKNRKVVRYLKKEFKKAGLQAVKQSFIAQLRTVNQESLVKKKTWNVVAFIEGNDPDFKDEFIVLGAHYDHLGLGGPSSKSTIKNTIHYGADDNASGTAALLEIAEKIAVQQHKLKRSVMFIAFGAEEHGLLGSKYFVNNPLQPINQIKLMINMDMVGRLNEKKQVYMGGAGTFPNGVSFMENLGKDLHLNPIVHTGGVGGSDHVSFYKKNIAVLGIHTGGHPQYHTPNDTIDLINFEGHKQVSEYVFETIMRLASTNYTLNFIKQN